MLKLTQGASGASIALACGGELIYEGNKLSSHAVIDSRKADKGSIFVAIKGERTDGHLYITSSAKKGASAVIAESIPDDITPLKENGCSLILVNDSANALALLAKKHKSELDVLTVGVTGSVGKTTTTDRKGHGQGNILPYQHLPRGKMDLLCRYP